MVKKGSRCTNLGGHVGQPVTLLDLLLDQAVHFVLAVVLGRQAPLVRREDLKPGDTRRGREGGETVTTTLPRHHSPPRAAATGVPLIPTCNACT